ncbi:YkgJ family cysteine cluster protein [Shigella flexneri]
MADIPCQHLKHQGGCAIYDERPSVCRTWYCGWRILDIGQRCVLIGVEF